MFVPFQSLPDYSRIWIYQANKKLDSTSVAILSETLKTFTENWTVHGQPMRASFDIRFDRFVILAANEGINAASGCSIDSSVRTLKEVGQILQVDFFDRNEVAFKNDNDVLTLKISTLKNHLSSGDWNANTLVFHNLINEKSQLETGWLIPAKASWLKRYLPHETVAH
ncbi:MAG TPA: hypothetical protein PLJ60_12070 [Chryseolinea sp.]|nr:hypothetical protein [Chryseolinea sp.]HPH46713.1 hypothetical protein [Chryseolinea sp.]HPM31061.1 hypothetical protein [Chryseolinea sp.]